MVKDSLAKKIVFYCCILLKNLDGERMLRLKNGKLCNDIELYLHDKYLVVSNNRYLITTDHHPMLL
jgi:hypothetical protein